MEAIENYKIFIKIPSSKSLHEDIRIYFNRYWYPFLIFSLFLLLVFLSTALMFCSFSDRSLYLRPHCCGCCVGLSRCGEQGLL